jgi:MFS transporter, DHA1 family, staphyloferrin A biosynthesis exporter
MHALRKQLIATNRLVEALSVRDYRYLWFGGLLSNVGDWMDQVTLSWLVLSITDSPLWVGLLHACRFLPLLVFGLWGGVLADRFDRRVMLIRTQIASLIVTIGLAIVAFQPQPDLVLVFIFAISRGALLSFDRPARHALMPELVPRPLLMNAVALQSAAHNISRVIGPAVAGLIIALVGTSWSLVFTASLFIPNLASLRAIRAGSASSARDRHAGQGGIVEGLKYAWSEPSVAMVLGSTMLILVFLAPHLSMLPVIARDVLQGGPAEYGTLNAAAGAGSLVGTVAIAWLGARAAHGGMLIGGALAFGVSVIAFAMSSWYPLSVILIMIAGGCSQAYFTTSTTLLQTMVPDELRGRIMSIYLMDRAVYPAGSVLAGALATSWGAPIAIAGLAAACIGVILVVTFRFPSLRAVGFEPRAAG